MTPEQLAESELRMTRFLTKKWPWQSWKVRKAFVAAGVPEEELAVVVAYKRSEERDGMSRTTRAKGIKRPSGPVSGYKTLPEPIVEKSLDVVPEVLWGTDVTAAVQEELGFDAAPRRQSGPGRRKLAPVRLTQEFTLGKRTLVGAGDGSSGHAVPELLPDGTLSYAVEPTVGECHEAELRKAPVRKAAESGCTMRLSRCVGCRPCGRSGGATRLVWRAAVGRLSGPWRPCRGASTSIGLGGS